MGHSYTIAVTCVHVQKTLNFKLLRWKFGKSKQTTTKIIMASKRTSYTDDPNFPQFVKLPNYAEFLEACDNYIKEGGTEYDLKGLANLRTRCQNLASAKKHRQKRAKIRENLEKQAVIRDETIGQLYEAQILTYEETEMVKEKIRDAESSIREHHLLVTKCHPSAQPVDIETVMEEIEIAMAAMAMVAMAANDQVPAQPIDSNEFLDTEAELQMVAEVLDGNGN